ncbi:hypothetical protein SALBM311S_12411 [Streptomyces alboniger]
MLFPLVHGRLTVSPLASLLRTTAPGALISLGIELLQTGVPGQRVDIDSLLLNTAGVALAHALPDPRPAPGSAAGTSAPTGTPSARRTSLRVSTPTTSQGRDRAIERCFVPFVSVALKSDEAVTRTASDRRSRRSRNVPPRPPHQRPHDRRSGAALARRFGTSATTMRVIFVVSCLLPGPQFLLYIALWILFPSEGKAASTAW